MLTFGWIFDVKSWPDININILVIVCGKIDGENTPKIDKETNYLCFIVVNLPQSSVKWRQATSSDVSIWLNNQG